MSTSDKYNTSKVIEVKNGQITGNPINRPNWTDAETGEYLTDQQLIDRENLYPLLKGPETKPGFDSFHQNCNIDQFKNWNVLSDRVEATWIINDIGLDNVINREIQNIADKRWKYETGGMNYSLDDSNVIKVHTGRDSQSKIAVVALGVKQGNINTSKKWKTLEGFKTLSPSELGRLGDELNLFIQTCYDREDEIINMLINCNNYDEVKNIVNNEFNIGWPTNAI